MNIPVLVDPQRLFGRPMIAFKQLDRGGLRYQMWKNSLKSIPPSRTDKRVVEEPSKKQGQ